ncbi:hypothetical protein EDD11_000394 [Mortierella claussenii]|nr:hypothetical protein EDD11_000394 [Mortierella claussenii]
MSGSSRYNGPGAALRGQPRAPRQQSRPREDGHASSNVPDNSSNYAGSDRQQRYVDKNDSINGQKDLAEMASPRSYTTASAHQRQWSDTSSLQGGALPPIHQHQHQHQHQPYQTAQNYPYSDSNHSPYMEPSSGSPTSPPPISPSPSSSSSYFFSPDQRSHGNAYPPPQRHQQYQQHLPSQSRSNHQGSVPSQYSHGMSANGGHPGHTAYSSSSQYDQSPMMSPISPDSWRSPPGPRGYASHTSNYTPSTQYRQPIQHKPYSTASSVISNDDHNSHQGRPGHRAYDYDSDDYYNRQNGRGTPSYGAGGMQEQGQGQSRFTNDRGGGGLSYSTSIASNTSSVLAARRENNDRMGQAQRSRPPPTDDWLTSPTGTEQETEILPWSDDEAIVTKAVRSPPIGYSHEKSLPLIPGRGTQTGIKSDSDMIKVEVGGATTIIPTTDEGSGVNFIKNVLPSSSPMVSKYNNLSQGPSGATQSMTGAATSLRAAAAFGHSMAVPNENSFTQHPRPPAKRASSDWGGKRISLDDMLSSPPTVTHESRQQAMDSWRTSPPLKARGGDKSTFTELKNKRRSSLPDKFVPNWNEDAQNWRSSIGQRRPSWMASNAGLHEDSVGGKSKDDLATQRQHWDEYRQQPSQQSVIQMDQAKDVKADSHQRLSDQRSLHRRSRSWSPHPPLTRNGPSSSPIHQGKPQDPAVTHRHDSYASTISRSRSRSASPKRLSRDRIDRRSFSRSRSPSLHSRSRSDSRSRSRSRSRSGSRMRGDHHSHYVSRSRSGSRSRPRSQSPLVHARRDSNRVNGSNDSKEYGHKSSPFSWQSASDAKRPRRSWESEAHESIEGVGHARVTENTHYTAVRKHYSTSTSGEEDDEADSTLHNGKGSEVDKPVFEAEGRGPLLQQGQKGGGVDSDTESLDSPPLKVQYARRGAPNGSDEDDDDVDQVIVPKHPVSVISTFSLPPATSPTSPPPPPPPPLPNTFSAAASQPARPAPPPVPASPPLAANQNESLMTSVMTVSIEAPTATILSSRVSVESFKNVPGHAVGDVRQKIYAGADMESDVESQVGSYKRNMTPIQPSYVSMTGALGNDGSAGPTSTAPSPHPTSINTSQLSRNESSTSSISVISARSARSFVSSTSVHSVSSILSASPPPQRAPPPVPNVDAASSAPTVGSGLFNTTKRSGSSGSGRGTRSGLSKQVLPPVIPPPPGPPPEVPGSKPSYGILPPPIPSSFTHPSSATDTRSGHGAAAATADAIAASSAAIQIEVLADEDQSKSQMGAIAVESDERLLTRLKNRIAQLEKELELALQDLEVSQDDAQELQSKVHGLENEVEELLQSSAATLGARDTNRDEEHELARETWKSERAQMNQDIKRLREEHGAALEDSLQRERSKHAEEMERLALDHTTALQDRLATFTREQELAQKEHSRALEDQTASIRTEHKRALDILLLQLESLALQHSQESEAQRSEHEAKSLEQQTELETRLKSIQAQAAKDLEEMAAAHELQVDSFENRLKEVGMSLSGRTAERDQAHADLEHHKRETEQALDRLEEVLAQDKQAHLQLVKGLEQKAKVLEDRVAELESELQELMQDNVQIVEEMQRREESWNQERTLLLSRHDEEGGHETRLQEVHEQLTAMAESKRQADVQFQGIVKGLLREASANKKELENRQNQLEQEKQGKEQILLQLESIQQEMGALEQQTLTFQQQTEALEGEKRSIQHEMQALQQEKEELQQQRQKLLQEQELANDKWSTLERSQRDMEAQLEAQKKSSHETMQNLQDQWADRLHQQEQLLEAERAKVLALKSTLDQDLTKAKGELQQEQFVWKTRLDQVEATLKTKEAQVRKLEQEADATIKIQTDLLQSMERDAANSQRKLEASLTAKMMEMEQQFEEDKRRLQQQFEEDKKRVQQQVHQELTQQYEHDSQEKEAYLQQQLESIHQQELVMAQQELVSKHEQQLRALRQQHDSALEQTSVSSRQQQKSVEEQLEKLQRQVEQERSEKDSAMKDRTFLERRMAGHDRRQKELEESLESLQQQLDQSRTKFGQDLQEVERSKMSLERKLGMAKEDVEELHKIRDELEADRDELRQELQRLKKMSLGRGGTGTGSGGSGVDTAAWDAERRSLQEQVRKLEDEVQIMLEKNMNLTIELSMR